MRPTTLHPYRNVHVHICHIQKREREARAALTESDSMLAFTQRQLRMLTQSPVVMAPPPSAQGQAGGRPPRHGGAQEAYYEDNPMFGWVVRSSFEFSLIFYSLHSSILRFMHMHMYISPLT